MLMDERVIIESIKNSEGILSNQTLIAQHPWIEDVEDELQKIEDEKQKAMEEIERQQYDPFQSRDAMQEEMQMRHMPVLRFLLILRVLMCWVITVKQNLVEF